MAKKKTKKKISDVSVIDQPEMDEEVAKVLASIRKDFGKDSIMCMGDAPDAIPSTSSGCLSLDFALGGSGYPHGRIIELFGVEAGGKTTLALHAVGAFQKEGRPAAFIDAEHSLNPAWAEQLGVDTRKLVISQPNSGEEALNICLKLVESAAFGVVVVDSVAALVPQAELDGDIGDTHVALLARMMSQALRRLPSKAHQTNTTVIFINQIREKIGVLFGSPEVTPGGRALKFYASIRVDIRRIGQIKDGDQVVGNRTTAKIAKNKVAPPFKKAEFDIIFTEGISWSGDLIDLGVQYGIVDKSGAWFAYGDTRLGQGREKAKEFLRNNLDVAAEIEQKIKDAYLAANPTVKRRAAQAVSEEKSKVEEEVQEATPMAGSE